MANTTNEPTKQDYESAYKAAEQAGLGLHFRSCSCDHYPCRMLTPIAQAIADARAPQEQQAVCVKCCGHDPALRCVDDQSCTFLMGGDGYGGFKLCGHRCVFPQEAAEQNQESVKDAGPSMDAVEVEKDSSVADAYRTALEIISQKSYDIWAFSECRSIAKNALASTPDTSVRADRDAAPEKSGV